MTLIRINKKLKERLDAIDWRSFFLTAIFLLIGVFLFFYFLDFQDRLRNDNYEKFAGEVVGEIISIEPLERISQSKWSGTKIYVDRYEVTYRYRVDGQTFQCIDVVPITNSNKKLISEITRTATNKACQVRFDLEDPSKSLLTERNISVK